MFPQEVPRTRLVLSIIWLLSPNFTTGCVLSFWAKQALRGLDSVLWEVYLGILLDFHFDFQSKVVFYLSIFNTPTSSFFKRHGLINRFLPWCVGTVQLGYRVFKFYLYVMHNPLGFSSDIISIIKAIYLYIAWSWPRQQKRQGIRSVNFL